MKKKLFRKSLKNPYAKKVINSYKKQILKDFKRNSGDLATVAHKKHIKTLIKNTLNNIK